MVSPSVADNELTEGELIGPMVRLAWPMVVIQLLQVAYNLADTFWLGRLSADAVGAISLAFPLIFLLISVGGGFTAAGSILVAQHRGAGGDTAAGLVAGQTIAFVGLVATALGIAGHFLAEPLLSLLPTDPETAEAVVPPAIEYMEVFLLGVPALFGFFVFVSLMRGYGNTRTPMRIMAVSVAINVVLDPLLIFGWWVFPPMGIVGAAVATVAARAVATVLGFYVLFRTDVGPDIALDDLRPRSEQVRRIVDLGVPTALEQSSTAFALVVMTVLVASFPPAVVAAYGLGNRLISLVFLPAIGLGQAVDTVVGQNLGADRPDRAERATYLAVKLVAAVMVGVAVVVALFPDPIVTVFLPPGTERATETIEYARSYLRISSIAYVFMGMRHVVLGGFRGAGNTRTALAFSLLTFAGLRVPATYLLAFVLDLGATGIWLGVAVGDVIGALAALAWFSRGTWKEAIVDEGPGGPGGPTAGDAEGATPESDSDSEAEPGTVGSD
jgi:putative MATE family efflux protein